MLAFVWLQNMTCSLDSVIEVKLLKLSSAEQNPGVLRTLRARLLGVVREQAQSSRWRLECSNSCFLADSFFFSLLVLGYAIPPPLASLFLLREGLSAAGIGTVLINVSRLGLVLPSWLQWDVERRGDSLCAKAVTHDLYPDVIPLHPWGLELQYKVTGMAYVFCGFFLDCGWLFSTCILVWSAPHHFLFPDTFLPMM